MWNKLLTSSRRQEKFPREQKSLQTPAQGSITALSHTKLHKVIHLLMRLISCAQGYISARWWVQELIRVEIYDWPWIITLWAQLDWPERRDAVDAWQEDKWAKRGKAEQWEWDEGRHKSIRLLLSRSPSITVRLTGFGRSRPETCQLCSPPLRFVRFDKTLTIQKTKQTLSEVSIECESKTRLWGRQTMQTQRLKSTFPSNKFIA